MCTISIRQTNRLKHQTSRLTSRPPPAPSNQPSAVRNSPVSRSMSLSLIYLPDPKRETPVAARLMTITPT